MKKLGSRSKKNRPPKIKSSFDTLNEHYKDIPFVNENGDVNKRPPNAGGIDLMYCFHCKMPSYTHIANICAICGKETKRTLLTVKELQGRSIKLKQKGYLIIGHEDPKWWR